MQRERTIRRIMPIPQRSTPITTTRVPLSDIAYQHLLDQIGAGKLPAGAAIEDKQIAAELGMSPATVRAAISRLAEIGMIEMAPNRYTRVAIPSPARFIDTIRVAVALWRLGGHLFLQHNHTAELAKQFHDRTQLVIDGASAITDGNTYISQVLDVFDFLTHHAGNPVLTDTTARLRPVIAHTARQGEAAYDLPGTVALMTALQTAVTNNDAAALNAALTDINHLADEFLTRHTNQPLTQSLIG